MIINIPLSINEEEMTKVIERDYQNKVIDKIVDYIKKALVTQSREFYGDREMNGMIAVIEDKVEDYIQKYKNEIIEIAGKHLAEKLVKTKKGKELLEEVAKEVKN